MAYNGFGKSFVYLSMKIFHSSSELVAHVESVKKLGQSVGFVPTMGALHHGHLSLIESSIKENDITIASIFINPLQFNNENDFINYPQTPDRDSLMLQNAGCDLLYLPIKEELYPPGSIQIFDLHGLDVPMEGRHRPGHFQGMANVVFRFFQIIQPNRAYFGLKDYQQFIIIKNCIAPLFSKLEIKGVHTLRESSGLAMSSRNMRLTDSQKQQASCVYRLLKTQLNQLGEKKVGVLTKEIEAAFKAWEELRLEYVDFAEENTLAPWKEKGDPKQFRIFIAFYAGETRLIDNLGFGELSLY